MDSADEKIMVPPTESAQNREIRVNINRDPKLKKKQSASSEQGK